MKKNYDLEFNGVELGQTGEDLITGFRGTVTGFCLYLTGCAQACLSPKMDDKGELKDARWFDITRIVVDWSRAPVELVVSPDDVARQAVRKGAPAGYGEQPPTR